MDKSANRSGRFIPFYLDFYNHKNSKKPHPMRGKEFDLRLYSSKLTQVSEEGC